VGYGHSPRLQCAHIISRRYLATRWDPQNAVALCSSHHVFYTHRPLEWVDWANANGFVSYEELRYRALNYPVPDLGEVLATLGKKAA
jgi:hypothetical protein